MKVFSVAATRVVAISFLLAFFICLSGADASTALFDRTLLIQNLASKLKTPDAVADFMWKNFVFEKDQRQFGKSDYWQNPYELIQSQKGDCEDFAIFAKALLKANGIPSFLLSVYANGYAHTLCIFKENGSYHVIDQMTLTRHETKSLRNIIKEIQPRWERASIVTISEENRKGIILKTIYRKVS